MNSITHGAPPRRAHASDAVAPHILVIDDTTGQAIERVTEADVDAGTLTRFAIDETGHLVRKDNAFEMVTETRAIRIEWRQPESSGFDPFDLTDVVDQQGAEPTDEQG